MMAKATAMRLWSAHHHSLALLHPHDTRTTHSSLTLSLTHSSLTHSLAHSLTHSLLAHSLTRSLTRSLTHSLTHWTAFLFRPRNHSMTHSSLTHWTYVSLPSTHSRAHSATLFVAQCSSRTRRLNYSADHRRRVVVVFWLKYRLLLFMRLIARKLGDAAGEIIRDSADHVEAVRWRLLF